MSVMRNKGVFGEDADVFRPERWLGLDPAQRRHMANTAELSFGYGRFGCSGKQVAFIELNKIYVELLRYFDFHLVNPGKPFDFTANAFTQHAKGLWVRVTERKPISQ
ncbi:unnamed protein product [Clonostachys rhizophaga]|uniref:Cytochrome P450 n=1 Tax=Clonostachys rhizophaga TaxID=160324 RepID=A0A9N9VFJ8_9HYPO|nr:unnamed protein product [Clonostachys rhizophaga]